MQSLQDHFTNSSLGLISELHSEGYAVVENNYFPFNFLQAYGLDANLLCADVLLSNPRPLRVVSAGEVPDSSITPQMNLDPGIEASGQSYTPGRSSDSSYLKSIFSYDTVPSRADLSMPIVDNAITQATSSLSSALCPATVVDCYEDLMVQMIGYSSSHSQGEKGSISKMIEFEVPAQNGVLNKSNIELSYSGVQQSKQVKKSKETGSQKATNRRIYRAKIADGIKALKKVMSYSEKVNQASVLDDVIDYIRFLKLKLNVLSQRRLIGEASTHSFVYIEGYGHYLLHPQAFHEPLEETIGHLLDSNPQTAHDLLDSKGLAIIPMEYAYLILQNISNPNTPNSTQ